MLAGDFQRNLRRLNPQLRIWCGDDNSKPASIFYVKNGEFEQVCGIDKNWIPENTQIAPTGMFTKGGWRRALRILIQRRLVERRDAERVFLTHFPYAPRVPKIPRYRSAGGLADQMVERRYTPEEVAEIRKWQEKRGN